MNPRCLKGAKQGFQRVRVANFFPSALEDARGLIH
jgi:hypothetical protein